MTVMIVLMLGILVLAGTVVLYVAYPHRGEQVPQLPWVGDALRRGVDALPTIDNQSVGHIEGRREPEDAATGSR